MKHEQIEAIRERAEDTSFEKAYVKGDPWKGYEVRSEGNGMVIAEASCGTDADFIAHAREDVPALLAEVERLRNSLGWHANPSNYTANVTSCDGLPAIDNDLGELARITLDSGVKMPRNPNKRACVARNITLGGR